MPYQSSGGRRNNVQFGVGQTIWTGTPPPAIPERVLDGLPGFAAWLALLLCILFAVVAPRLLLTIAVSVAFYAAIRFLIAGIANVIGLRKIGEWQLINWGDYYQAQRTPESLPWDVVRHIVIIPNYKEPLHVLAHTLDNLAVQSNAREQLIIVLAMEAAEAESIAKAEQLQRDYAGKFHRLLYTVHPRGLPGEMQCKSANQAWAARWAKRRLVDELGYDIDHLVVTTMDADTIWHRNYFPALTALFALNPQRYLRFWQAPIRYHSNIWEINPLMRIVNAYSTAFELAYLSA
ncbi:MAG TPA: glycosyltransferase, partial [Candidatus Limnocylindrales bacterium]|nr:glycosyltransferase [Candidatus Limnocylindrales bacterium]